MLQPSELHEVPDSTKKLTGKPKSKIKTAGIVLLVFVAIFLLTGGPKSIDFPSHYVDDDPVGPHYPDNQGYVYNGPFYRLGIQYPASIGKRVMGYGEHILSFTDSTHYMALNVSDFNQTHVRYRIRNMMLKSTGGKIYQPKVFQRDMYRDLVDEFLYDDGKKLKSEEVNAITTKASELVRQADFTHTDDQASIFYGYKIHDKPKDLELSFTIDVYLPDGSAKDTHDAVVMLHRLDEEDTAYIARQMRSRR